MPRFSDRATRDTRSHTNWLEFGRKAPPVYLCLNRIVGY
jgi:hypothetical protein